MYLTISVDLTGFFITKDRLSDFPLYRGELEQIADLTKELVEKSDTISWIKSAYKNISEITIEPSTNNTLLFVLEVTEFIGCPEEGVVLQTAFKECAEKAVRMTVEEVFFDER